LENDFEQTKNLYRKLAKEYVYTRYNDEREKTYGLIASSKGTQLQKVGVDNSFGKQPKANVFFAKPEDSRYCTKLNDCVTEFACQGLELDFPIVFWDNDFLIQDENCKEKRANKKTKNSLKLRKNTYRVLLTRGRDGMIIFFLILQNLTQLIKFLKT